MRIITDDMDCSGCMGVPTDAGMTMMTHHNPYVGASIPEVKQAVNLTKQ